MTIVDLDDFCEDNHSLPLLLELKRQIPGFCATLFTIPARCSIDWIRWLRRVHGDWLDLVAHGWTHDTSRECQHWSHSRMRAYMSEIARFEFTLGWKAPGWQISDASYDVLAEAGYWLADQKYNESRRPFGLLFYELDSGDKIHGHIGHLGGNNPNELSLIMPIILSRAHERFDFVRDHLRIWQPTTSSSRTSAPAL